MAGEVSGERANNDLLAEAVCACERLRLEAREQLPPGAQSERAVRAQHSRDALRFFLGGFSRKLPGGGARDGGALLIALWTLC